MFNLQTKGHLLRDTHYAGCVMCRPPPTLSTKNVKQWYSMHDRTELVKCTLYSQRRAAFAQWRGVGGASGGSCPPNNFFYCYLPPQNEKIKAFAPPKWLTMDAHFARIDYHTDSSKRKLLDPYGGILHPSKAYHCQKLIITCFYYSLYSI